LTIPMATAFVHVVVEEDLDKALSEAEATMENEETEVAVAEEATMGVEVAMDFSTMTTAISVKAMVTDHRLQNPAQSAPPQGWNAESHHFDQIEDYGGSRRPRWGWVWTQGFISRR
jgi:hypothetical protein